MVVNKPALYVVDSSVYISYLLPDESFPDSLKQIFRKFTLHKADFVAPTILKYEIGNALRSSVRQKRIKETEAIEIYETFIKFPIHYSTPNYQDILRLSLERNLSFYDASYLCLAQEKKAKLLTLDKKLLTCLPK